MRKATDRIQDLKHSLRIEVRGGIASGKTTLATLLQHAGIDTALENFQTNPFWEASYRDPIRHALETEVTFLLQHYHQIKVSGATAKVFARDFSLLLDLAYANVTLHGSKRQTFLAVYKEVVKDLATTAIILRSRSGAVSSAATRGLSCCRRSLLSKNLRRSARCWRRCRFANPSSSRMIEARSARKLRL
jgi:hypothetical protein